LKQDKSNFLSSAQRDSSITSLSASPASALSNELSPPAIRRRALQSSAKTQKRSPTQSCKRRTHCSGFSSSLQFLFEAVQFTARFFQFISLPDEQSHQARQAEPRKIENLAHRWIESRARKNDRLGMLRPPPPDRPIHQRRIQKCKHAEECTD